MAIDLQAAIAVFDKSADRTKPNAQTEAWAVIRAELMRVMDAPVGTILDGAALWELVAPVKHHEAIDSLVGQRVRLVPVGGEG